MKKHRRQSHKDTPHTIIDIKNEIPQTQLAALGALALAFNETEAALDRLFFAVTALSDTLQLEVSTRIGGLDGKIEIIKKGGEQFLADPELHQLQEALGDGVFGTLKDYRDGAIHVRHLNPRTGVGTKVDRRARVFDYLIGETTLDVAYNLLIAVRKELDAVTTLVHGVRSLNSLSETDLNRSQLEVKLAAIRSQLQLCRTERLNLPQLPEFPAESELRQADLQANTAHTETLMKWYQQFSQPMQPQPARSLWLSQTIGVLSPLKEGGKKKP